MMMNNKTTKLVSLLVAALICMGSFSSANPAYAENAEFAASAESNFDFAVKTAEIIKNDNNENPMLRIMGRIIPDAADFDFPYVSDYAVSDDGRFVLQFSSEDKLVACLNELQSNPNIIYAERDIPVYTESLEESAEYLSWGVKAIEADIYSKHLASLIITESVTVAIVDSGCEDIDFIKDRLVGGYDFFENDSDAFQDVSVDSHGTFLAGIVADCTQNLPVNIMPVRVLDSEEGSILNLINGIRYAVDNGADVINLSLVASLSDCRALEEAMTYAEEKGVTVVVCAGNAANNIRNFCPAHCKTAITVTSLNPAIAFSESFSNFGNGVDLAAPGELIIGYNANGEKVALSGTSMSAAFVSAAAAMFILDNPTSSPEQVRSALTSCAKDLGSAGEDSFYGFGIPCLSKLIKPVTLRIKNNPIANVINFGETLRLTAEVTNQPKNTTVCWYVDGVRLGEGETFEVSPESTSVKVTARLLTADGTVMKDQDGNEVSDSQTVSVKSGFLQKLISFFKNLFKLSRIVVQTVMEV